jgi:hypothetical protein
VQIQPARKAMTFKEISRLELGSDPLGRGLLRQRLIQGSGPTSQGGGVVRSTRCSTNVFTLGEMWRALG